MGEPEVATQDQTTGLLLSLLSPKGAVQGEQLVKTGLHRLVLQQYFEAVRPEIENLTGWQPLRGFSYVPYWRDTTQEDGDKGKKRTAQWLKLLEEAGIADEKAIQIFDGEKMRPPAPDYRLFLLRDGRLLHYAGGFHADGWREPVVSCGHVLTVLEAMGDGYGSFGSSSRWLSFMIIMDSVNSALEAAIAHRQRTLDEQQALHAQLTQLVKRIR